MALSKYLWALEIQKWAVPHHDKLFRTHHAGEVLSNVNRLFGFGNGTAEQMRIYQILLRGEQLLYCVHAITLRVTFSPSLMIAEDVDADSWVSAIRKLNGLKD